MLRALATLALVLAAACGPSTPAASTAPTAAAATAAATTAAPTAPPATPAPATTAPLPAFEDGRFTGTWTNTTFGSTGNAAFEVKVDRTARTLAVTITLTGNVFGAPAPSPETFTIPIGATGGTFSGKSKTFGDVTANLRSDGTVTFRGDNVPGGRVKSIDGNGTWTTTAISLAYNVALADGSSAKGTVSLKKA